MSLRLAIFALLTFLHLPAESSAKVILITHGETFSHLGEITAKERPQDVPPGFSVGYKYWYGGVFWLDFWRSDGAYCLYSDKNYIPLTKAEAAELLGVSESSLGEPFFYHFPPGLIVLGVLIVVGIAGAIAKEAKKRKVMELVRDGRYQKALEIFRDQIAANEAAKAEALAKNEPPPETAVDPWNAAINHLVETGIEKNEAEEKFGKVVAHAVAQTT